MERGFDFLGYRFTPAGLEIAPVAIRRFLERASRLYDQGAGDPQERAARLGIYFLRWYRWAHSGLAGGPAADALIT